MVFFIFEKKEHFFMNFKSFFFLFLLVASYSCKSESEKIAESSAARKALIDSTIDQFQRKLLSQQIDSIFSKYRFNGSVAILKNKEVIYQKENGFENFETRKKLDSSSVFPIASISKQFTAAMIMIQQEAGTLSTEDEVSKYLKSFQSPEFNNITIQQLLNHTSGISDFGNGLLAKPGKEFHYSNKGFRLLGEVLEKVSGKTYDENLRDLFKKAGMTNSFSADHLASKNFAGAYTGNAAVFQKVDHMPQRLAQSAISVPAGGILSTVGDLNRWNQALYNGKILNLKSLRDFGSKSADRNHPIFGKMDYGYGIMMNPGKPNAYFHSGYVKGAPALNVYYPDTKTSVIILSNIAEETRGKNSIFNPHREIKAFTDALQMAIVQLHTEMVKPVKQAENNNN